MSKYKDVKRFDYPSKVTIMEVLRGSWQTSKIGLTFHFLMAILMVSGLAIDLLGIFLGGALTPIRSIFHGYLGAVLVIVFPIYLVQVLATKKIRMLLTTVNYVNFALYAILIITGISIASVNKIWVETMPWLSIALSDLRKIAPILHTLTTYVWLLFSTIFPGGLLHGIATGYLILIEREKK